MSDSTAAAEPRATGSWGLWLVVATVAVLAAAMFAGTRMKPPGIFAAGFGFVLGIVVRFAAEALAVPRNWRTAIVSALLVGCGFVFSFVSSYRNQAAEWDRYHTAAPSDPIAAAMLSQVPAGEAAPPAPLKYTIARYLSQRFFDWPAPWPAVGFGAECIVCVLVAGACMGFTSPRRKQGP